MYLSFMRNNPEEKIQFVLFSIKLSLDSFIFFTFDYMISKLLDGLPTTTLYIESVLDSSTHLGSMRQHKRLIITITVCNFGRVPTAQLQSNLYCKFEFFIFPFDLFSVTFQIWFIFAILQKRLKKVFVNVHLNQQLKRYSAWQELCPWCFPWGYLWH